MLYSRSFSLVKKSGKCDLILQDFFSQLTLNKQNNSVDFIFKASPNFLRLTRPSSSHSHSEFQKQAMIYTVVGAGTIGVILAVKLNTFSL
jgi:hypothetical protein